MLRKALHHASDAHDLDVLLLVCQKSHFVWVEAPGLVAPDICEAVHNIEAVHHLLGVSVGLKVRPLQRTCKDSHRSHENGRFYNTNGYEEDFVENDRIREIVSR